MSQRICKGGRSRDREKRSTRGDTLSQVERAHVSLHRKWLCAKEISIPLTWNSNELASASTPQGVINFSCFLILPQDISVFTGAAGPFRAVLIIAVIRTTGCRQSYFFIQTRLKKRKLQAFLKIRDRLPLHFA